jgi:hypothetical protein
MTTVFGRPDSMQDTSTTDRRLLNPPDAGCRVVMAFLQMIAAVICIAFLSVADADNEVPPQTAKEVVADYFVHLNSGDVQSMDALFFKIPYIESNKEDWLKLIEHTAQIVKNEQSAWDVVCSKELSKTAVVIINQVLKHGKKHGDPDAVYLIRENNRWLISPDLIAYGARKETESFVGNTYRSERFMLKRWAVGEIRGLTTECSE